VAYGDATEDVPQLAWEEYEWTEYLYRLQDLINERARAFAIAHGNPDDPRAEWADDEWRRLDDALAETALEFAAYAARLRMRYE
jgi:hypothetical protein